MRLLGVKTVRLLGKAIVAAVRLTNRLIDYNLAAFID